MSKAVKTVAAVAVGAVVGFLMGGPAGAMYGAAMGLAVGAFATEMPVAKGTIRQNEPSSQTLRSSKAAARFILGKVSTGGVLNWAQEQPGEQTEGEWLHLVYVLSEGTIDGVEDVFLNEEPIGNYGADASYEVVRNPTEPNAFLLANCPGWKSTQIGKGLSYIRVSLKYSAEKFPSGIPDTRFVVRGRNDIYDPRTGASIYTENAALLILWYLRNRCGVPDSEIIMPSFASAANTCSEGVSNPDGGNSPARYRLGAVIGADERKTDVLQKMLDACSGRLIRVGGRWMLQVGAYYGPYDFTITEDMVIGAVTGTVEVDNESAINTISGTFVDPQQAWAETDYPSVSVQEWIAQDGVELSESLDLAYVFDPYQAQRLANIKLRQRRSGGALSIPLNFFGYNCRPGRVVRVNLPSLNIQGEFVVTDWSMSATDACTVTVEAYDAEQYDDAVGQPYNPIGFIQMPAGGLAAPTNLVWAPDMNPEVRQGVLSWVLPYGEIAYSGVVIRNEAGESVQTYQVPGATSNCQVQGLPAGRYAMSVFCRSEKGKSAEATITVSVLGPPQPQTISVQAGFDSITLIPFNVTSLNGGTYEYRYALTPVDQPEKATLLGRGGSFTHNGLAFNTTYHYYVRSVNAYGTSAYLYVSATTDSSAQNILKLLTGQILEGQLGKHLTDRIDLIDGGVGTPGSVAHQVAQEAKNRIDALTKEASERALADKANADALAAEAATRADAILAEAKSRIAAITTETQARQTADESLSKRIDTVSASIGDSAAAIQAEAKARADADSALAARVDTVAAATGSNASAITVEAKARTDADSALASRLDTLSASTSGNASAIASEASTRASADEAIGKRVDTVSATLAKKADSAAVDSLSTTVTQQGNTLTSQASSLTSLTSRVSETEKTNTAQSGSIQSLDTRVTSTEGALASQTQRVDGIYAQINPPLAGDASIPAGSSTVQAGVWSEQHARAAADMALAEQVDTVGAKAANAEAAITAEQQARASSDAALATQINSLSVKVNGEISAAITAEQKVRADADSALAQQVTTLSAKVDNDISAAIRTEQQVRADADSSLASRIDTVQAVAGDASALVQQTSQAVASLNDGVSTLWSVRMQVNSAGKAVNAGVGLGIDGKTQQSEFYVLADRFAVLTSLNGTVTSPFVVQNGQLIANSAIFGDATIGFAKIKDDIQSTNYQAGISGWILKKDGTFEINAPIAGGGRTVINSDGVSVFDPSGIRRVRLGKLR